MRQLSPLNRYLVVQPAEENADQTQQQILTPPGFKAEDPGFKVVQLRRAPKESALEEGASLLVPSNMVEEISILNTKYYLILENYVVGFFDDD